MSECSESSRGDDKKHLTKAEKSEQEYQRLLQRNNNKLFLTSKHQHQGQAASPFFVQLNPNSCAIQFPYGVQNQTFLYDKTRNQMMTTLNMHPITGTEDKPALERFYEQVYSFYHPALFFN